MLKIIMDGRIRGKGLTTNVKCMIIAAFALIVYIIIDGMGIITQSADMVNNVRLGLKPGQHSYVDTMMVLQGARMLILAIVLFPILFMIIRFHLSFKQKSTSNLINLIPYLRVILGLFAFYYSMTIGTVFEHEVFTTYYSLGIWFSLFRIVLSFVLLGAFTIDWPSAVKAFKRFPYSHPVLHKIIFVVFISVFSCLLLELQAGSKMNMMSNMIFFNILYWVIVQVFIDVLTRNMKIGAIVSLVLAYLIGLINDVVYQFRGNYVMFGDLTVVRTALEVAGNYKYNPGVWFWVSLLLLIGAIGITVSLKFPKHDKPGRKEIFFRIGIEIILVAGVVFTFSNGILYNNVFGVGWNYNENVKNTGYIPYFLSNMNSIQSVELEGYNAAIAEDILGGYEVPAEETHSYPNIIIIQNEAFSDLAVSYDIETNQDYMPFIRSLTDNTRKGYLNMSITGGPTANTEFEILMRSTLNFLPYGSVPYTQYVDTDLPSIAQFLKHQTEPYYTVAYHSYYSSGYRRIGVYGHFGFDEVMFEDNFIEDYPGTDLVRGLLSDSADYRRVEQMYEDFRSGSDAPWFCFNVTIQNHGGYTQSFEPSAEDSVYVTNFAATDSINEYLSLIKISDDAFRELIEYFEQCDEPTIIAMYGDHQPAFDDEAVRVLGDHIRDGINGEICNYYVPYIIWANFDIEEQDYLTDGVLNNLSPNYFASTVFDIAGVELTDYDRYLLEMHEQIPAITALGVWDNEGNYYASAAESPYSEDISNMEMVQYNLLFDDDNRLTDSFE